MRYLLDTNIVSYWMRGDVAVLERLKNTRPCDLHISVITIAEILYGIEKSPHKKQERMKKISMIRSMLETMSFDEKAAEQYAVVRSTLECEGKVISERDLQIASIALVNRLCLVTHNAAEFSRIKDLIWEDWA